MPLGKKKVAKTGKKMPPPTIPRKLANQQDGESVDLPRKRDAPSRSNPAPSHAYKKKGSRAESLRDGVVTRMAKKKRGSGGKIEEEEEEEEEEEVEEEEEETALHFGAAKKPVPKKSKIDVAPSTKKRSKSKAAIYVYSGDDDDDEEYDVAGENWRRTSDSDDEEEEERSQVLIDMERQMKVLAQKIADHKAKDRIRHGRSTTHPLRTRAPYDNFLDDLQERDETLSAMSARGMPNNMNRLLNVGDPRNVTDWRSNAAVGYPKIGLSDSVQDALEKAALRNQMDRICGICKLHPLVSSASLLVPNGVVQMVANSMSPANQTRYFALLDELRSIQHQHAPTEFPRGSIRMWPGLPDCPASNNAVSAYSPPSVPGYRQYGPPVGPYPVHAASANPYHTGGAWDDPSEWGRERDLAGPGGNISFSDASQLQSSAVMSSNSKALRTVARPANLLAEGCLYTIAFMHLATGLQQYRRPVMPSTQLSPMDLAKCVALLSKLSLRSACRDNYGINFPVHYQVVFATYRGRFGKLSLWDFRDIPVDDAEANNEVEFPPDSVLKPRSMEELSALPAPGSPTEFKIRASNMNVWFGFMFGLEVKERLDTYLKELMTRAGNFTRCRYRLNTSMLVQWWQQAMDKLELLFHQSVITLVAKIRELPQITGSLDSYPVFLKVVQQVLSQFPEEFSEPWQSLEIDNPDGILLRQHSASESRVDNFQKNALASHLESSDLPEGPRKKNKKTKPQVPSQGKQPPMASRPPAPRALPQIYDSSWPVSLEEAVALRDSFRGTDSTGARLCYSLLKGFKCAKGEACPFSHDFDANNMSNHAKYYVVTSGRSYPGQRNPSSLPAHRNEAIRLYPLACLDRDSPGSSSSSRSTGTRAGRKETSPAVDHLLEYPLQMLLSAARKQSKLDVSSLRGPPSVRLIALRGDDSPFAQLTRTLRVKVFALYPALGQALKPPLDAHVMSVIAHLMTDTPSLDVGTALMLALDTLASSVLPGARLVAAACYPRIPASNSLFLNGDVQGTLRAIATGNGTPILRFACKSTSRSLFFLGESMFECLDLGDTAGGLTDQCVLLVLANIVGKSWSALVSHFRTEALRFASSWDPSIPLSQVQQSILRLLHDLLHPCHGFHDVHLVRYLSGGWFDHIRIILFSANDSGLTTELQVIQSPRWNLLEDRLTYCLVICKKHCQVMSVLPPAVGGRVLLCPRRQNVSSMTPQEGDDLVQMGVSMGLTPSFLLHVLPVHHTATALGERPCDRVLRENLPRCPRCADYFPNTSAGKSSPASSGPSLPPHLLPHVQSLTGADGTFVASLPSSLAYNGDMFWPHSVHQWFETIHAVDGLSVSTLSMVAQNRSDDYRKHVAQDSSSLGNVVPNHLLAPASELLLRAQTHLSRLDRPSLRAGSTEQLSLLVNALLDVLNRMDALVRSADSVRLALAAIRLATVRSKDGLPLNADRIHKHLSGLIPPNHIKVLQSLSLSGVPLWDMSSDVPENMREVTPHASASAAVIDMSYTTLRDVSNGNAVIVSGEVKSFLDAADTKYFPQGAVEKKGPDGKPSGAVRPISDAREINAEIKNSLAQRILLTEACEPPAVCARMVDIIRTIIAFTLMLPGVDILLFKLDVEDAFKKIHLNYADATSWASVLAKLEGMGGQTIMLPLSLMFGGEHCPGWFGTAVWPILHAWSKCGPDEPGLNGDITWSGTAHVDDLIAIVPRIGNLPNIALQDLEDKIKAVLGPHAINDAKKGEEGTPSKVCKVLGFILNLEMVREEGASGATISIPEDKVDKLVALLSDDFLGRVARRNVKLKEHQVVQGLVQWFSTVSASLKSLLADLYPMCASSNPMYVVLEGSDAAVALTWHRYAEALELIKILCLDMRQYSSSLSSPICCALHPHDQILLGMPHSFLGSDATLSVSAAVDYHNETWSAVNIVEVLETLRRELKPDEQTGRVAWSEFLPVLLMILQGGNYLTNRIVYAAVDNVEAVAAINKKPMKDPVMRRLQHLLLRLETRYHLEVIAFYINTKHNVLADDISRLYPVLSHQELQAHIDTLHPGLTHVSVDKEVAYVIAEACKSFVLLDGDDHTQAKALASTRLSRLLESELLDQVSSPDPHIRKGNHPWEVFTAEVINAGIGQVVAAIEAVGGKCVRISEASRAAEKIALNRSASITRGDTEEADLVWIDASYPKRITDEAVLARASRTISYNNPLIVVWTLRTQCTQLADNAVSLMNSLSYTLTSSEVVCGKSVNSCLRCSRLLLHFEPVTLDRSPLPLNPVPKIPGLGRRIKNCLTPWDELPADVWVKGKRRSAPPTSSVPGASPLACYLVDGSKSYPVQSIHDVADSLLAWGHPKKAGIGGKLIQDDRRSSIDNIRRLTVEEVCRLNGIPSSTLAQLDAMSQEEAYFWIGGSISWDLASVIATRCAVRLHGLKALIPLRTPTHDPRPCSRASGGPSRVTRATYYPERIEGLVYQLIDNSIGSSSHVTYESTFRANWIRFRMERGEPVFFAHTENQERVLLQFIAFKGLVEGYKWSSIHVMLFAIRFFFLRNFLGDPLYDKVLVKVAMKGLKRIQGGSVRKVPVTPDILRAVFMKLKLEKWDDLVLGTSIMFMYIFLLRSREVVAKDHADPKQCVRVNMVNFFCEGVEVYGNDIQYADEVGWMSAYSKTDPNGQGGTLNVFKVPESDLCVVKLLQKMHHMNPSHFAKGNRFLFTELSGKVVHRNKVVLALSTTALAMGLPPKAVSVISLRSGGATAMWEAGFSIDEIKKRGRWASECWRVYVWEGNDRSKNVARDMLRAKVNIRSSLAYYRRHAHEG